MCRRTTCTSISLHWWSQLHGFWCLGRKLPVPLTCALMALNPSGDLATNFYLNTTSRCLPVASDSMISIPNSFTSVHLYNRSPMLEALSLITGIKFLVHPRERFVSHLWFTISLHSQSNYLPLPMKYFPPSSQSWFES
jgi:hypothetical protein